MPLVTCQEAICNLPHKATITIKADPTAFRTWKATQLGTMEQFVGILSDRALIKASDLFQCDIGVETTTNQGDAVTLNVAHDCGVGSEGFAQTVEGMVQIINDEVGEARNKVSVLMDEHENPYVRDQERRIVSVLKDVGQCSVFVPRWNSPDGKERRVLVPTRHCLDRVQSALSSIHLALEHEPTMWDTAKTKGEKVTIDEDIIGSYLFYRLRGDHPLSMDACQELFDSKVIDGAGLSYSTPKKKAPDIAVDIKEMLEQLYPEQTGQAFAQRIGRYIDDKRIQMARQGGPCEILTRPLKNSGEIPKSWVWFGDGDSILTFNPTDVARILKKWGYDVKVNPWKQEIERAPSVKVEGLNCSLRDYQVDPICRWTKRVASVLDTSADAPKITWTEKEIEKEGGLVKVKVLDSYTPDPALGGIIKAPTGAGKTIIGLVTLATQGAGVPQAEELIK